MKLNVEGISELVLQVKDMERAVEFWSETLGFPVVDQWSYSKGQFDTNSNENENVWATWLYIGGNSRLGLWLPRQFDKEDQKIKKSQISNWKNGLYDEGGIHVHFALYISPDYIDQTVSLLSNLGVDTTTRIHDEVMKEKSIYFKDTEDNVIEFYSKDMRKSYSSYL